MRVSGLEIDPSGIRSLALEPKVLQLIEKLGSSPILIQKLLLNSQPFIQLKIAQPAANPGSRPIDPPLIKQLDIPISAAKELAALARDPALQNSLQINLSASPKLISLELIPNSPVSPRSLPQPQASLHFTQAQLINSEVLQLSNQVKPGNIRQQQSTENILNPSRGKLHPDSPIVSTENNRANSTANIEKTPLTEPGNKLAADPTLKQAISYFLRSKPVGSQVLSNNLNNIFQKTDTLLRLINGNVSKTEQVFPQQVTLDNGDIRELLSKIVRFSPDAKLFKNFEQFLQQIGRLKQTLDFSQFNKQLKLENRVAASGIFLESQFSRDKPSQDKVQILNNKAILSETNIPLTPKTKISPGEPGQVPEQQKQVDTRRQSAPPDLKLFSLALKNTLEPLLNYFKSNNAMPVIAPRLINIVAQNINNILPEITSTLSGNSVSESTASLENIRTNPSTNLEGKSTDHLKNDTLFNSPALKQIFSNNQLQLIAKNITLSQIQEESLLSNQRQLISEILNEANAITSRIETNQLLSLRTESQQLQQFLLDLPIFHDEQIDSFELLFESKQEIDEKESSKTWTVTVKFDLDPLGPMFARISLKNNRIATRFFASNEITAQLLSTNIEHLKNSLFAAGLDIEEVSGQQGIVPDELITNDEYSVDVIV